MWNISHSWKQHVFKIGVTPVNVQSFSGNIKFFPDPSLISEPTVINNYFHLKNNPVTFKFPLTLRNSFQWNYSFYFYCLFCTQTFPCKNLLCSGYSQKKKRWLNSTLENFSPKNLITLLTPDSLNTKPARFHLCHQRE